MFFDKETMENSLFQSILWKSLTYFRNICEEVYFGKDAFQQPQNKSKKLSCGYFSRILATIFKAVKLQNISQWVLIVLPM